MIDLHMHTTYSDGTDSVVELLEKAEKANLEVISITDHNSCMSYFEMDNIDINELYKGSIILGCEFTTTFDNRLIEVLGYDFDYKKVQKYLDKYYSKELIIERTKTLYNRLMTKINDLGLIYNLEPFNDEKFEKEFFEFEMYMEIIKYPENKEKVKEDILDTFSDFFRKGLTNPKSYFFINHIEFKPSLEKIIDLIHSAGGKAFLAHPYQYKFSDTEEFLDNIYNNSKLDGIECYYTRFTAEQTKYVFEFAKKRGLLISGGSDYHGKNKTNHNLGVGKGNLNINKEILSNWDIEFYKE